MADPPILSGSFRAEAYGTLELKTEGTHVSGRVLEGGNCRFDSQREVLTGDFEGSVLVARLTVCQSGDLCPAEQSYTVLGFYNEEENAVVAHVRLSPGCSSKGLQKSGRFVLTPVIKEGLQGAPAGGSGPSLDPQNKQGLGTEDAARQASKLGDQFYQLGKWAEAVAYFKQSLDHDSGDSNWPAYLGRGSSLLKLGQVGPAIKDLEKAHSANPQHGSVLYMLGCAYAQKRDKPRALEYLRKAVGVGYALHSAVENDPELVRMVGTEPQFKELVRRSREKNSRGTAGSGNPSP